MADRYQRELREIIGVDEVLGGLGSAIERDSIPGSRGIGYEDGFGNAIGLNGSTGNTLAPLKVDGLSSDGQDAGTGDADPQDPTGNIVPQTDDTATAEELLNDDELKVGDKLKELEAKDCDSGKDIKIRTDGLFPAPDALVDEDGNTLSNEWDDANTPPDVVDFTLGKYWEGVGNVNHQGFNPTSVALAILEDLNASPVGGDDAGTGVLDSLNLVVATLYDADYTFNNGGGTRSFTIPVTQSDCIAAPPADSATCPASTPTEEFWPTTTENLDNAFYMTLKDGKFVDNEFDSQVPNNFKEDLGAIAFCFGSGQFGKMVPTADGGFMVYETDSFNGDPLAGKSIKLFNSESIFIAAIPTEAAGSYIAATQ